MTSQEIETQVRHLEVTKRQVYGNELIYPSCEVAKDFLKALGLKTFNDTAKRAARVLGFKLIIAQSEMGEV